MLNTILTLAITLLYMCVLYFVARWSTKSSLGERLHSSAPVYAFSLAIYCTTWTYYGSVGVMANQGLIFLTIYIGPILAFLLLPKFIERIINLKSNFKITSIADFISTRYDKSQRLAAIVTIVAIVGIIPYIALQLKAIISTFNLLTGTENLTLTENIIGPIMVILMTLFTIIFGVQRLDPTERHPGMMTAVAVESAFKLIVFVLCGIFITFFVFDSFEHIIESLPLYLSLPEMEKLNQGSELITWLSYTVISMSAIIFLPRQFHATFVENSSISRFRKGKYYIIGYLILINIFVIPIAYGGLASGLSRETADTFVLQLPLLSGNKWLATLVFLGGFSAATSMIMISTMTLSTMTTNHLVIPLLRIIPSLQFMRKKLLQIRWTAVGVIIFVGYLFVITIPDTYTLVNIGLLSFVAILQLAPIGFGAILWKKGNKIGALSGLTAGSILWCYTLLLPILAHKGVVPESIITEGLLGFSLLKPEALFGLNGIDNISNSVIWSLFFNLTFYIFGSLLTKQSIDEKHLSQKFAFQGIDDELYNNAKHIPASIDLAQKTTTIKQVFSQYFTESYSETNLNLCLENCNLHKKSNITVLELAKLHNETEKILSGTIGSAIANKELKESHLISEEERSSLQKVYAELLVDLNLPPAELLRKIDYFQEKNEIQKEYSQQLEASLVEKEKEIEERKKAESLLRKAEQKYRSIFENAIEGIFQTSIEGKILSCNPSFAKILGYNSPEEVISYIKSLREQLYVDPEDRDKFIENLSKNREIKDFETKFYKKDSSIIWVSISSVITHDELTAQAYIEGTMIDISERRRADEGIRKLNKTLLEERNVFTKGEVVVIRWNNEKNYPVSYVSPNVHEVFGYRSSEMLNTDFKYIDILHKDDQQQFLNELAILAKADLINYSHEDYRIISNDGRIKWLYNFTTVIKNDYGDVTDFIGYVIDITKRKEVENELISAKEKAETADKLKSNFLAQMSHEIRTPINTIFSYLSLLKMDMQDKLSEDNSDSFIAIENGANRLLRTIDLILNVSEMETGSYTTIFEAIDIELALTKLLKEFQRYAELKELNLNYSNLLEPETSLIADSYTFHQIFANLIDNAIKYTHKGNVTIISSKSEGKIQIEVLDSGIGIKPEYIPHLFEKFSQEDEGYTRKFEGNGLGLALVKKYCELNKADISVESKKGEGSRFIVSFEPKDENEHSSIKRIQK